MSTPARLQLKVTDVRCEARDVLLIELRDPDGGSLPPFTPGAHLEVYLPNGLIRHYSLCNASSERDRYCIGVGLSRDSRGGSRYIHQTVRVGMALSVSAPRNNFPLELGAKEYVFVAGGIGITPIMSMIRFCEETHRSWRLIYCARNRQRTAFYEDLVALADGRIHFHFDDERAGCFFDAAAVLSDIPESTHLYTCGPTPLMKAVEIATASRPQDRVHFEWFTAAPIESSDNRPFTVILKQSGQRLSVPAGRSILEILEDNDAGVPYSCREGLCGTCRTTVLKGECDHRDKVLSGAERASNKEMMICVSRAKGEEIELDL